MDIIINMISLITMIIIVTITTMIIAIIVITIIIIGRLHYDDRHMIILFNDYRDKKTHCLGISLAVQSGEAACRLFPQCRRSGGSD